MPFASGEARRQGGAVFSRIPGENKLSNSTISMNSSEDEGGARTLLQEPRYSFGNI